jgi:hypothetical protein
MYSIFGTYGEDTYIGMCSIFRYLWGRYISTQFLGTYGVGTYVLNFKVLKKYVDYKILFSMLHGYVMLSNISFTVSVCT